MPAFSYTARNRAGKTVKGLRILASEGLLLQDLAAEGFFLIRADLAPPPVKTTPKVKLKPKDFNLFLLHLASYQEAGLSLLDAFRDYRCTGRSSMVAVAQDMSQRIAGGASFADAMAAYPSLFQPVHLTMLRAGEATGRLAEALRAVIKLVEWGESLRVQIREAVTYPLLLICLLGLIVILVSVLCLPNIIKMLEDFHVPLPPITRVFLALGKGVARFWWLLLAVSLGIGLGLKSALRYPSFRLRWDTALLSVPLLGTLVRKKDKINLTFDQNVPCLRYGKNCYSSQMEHAFSPARRKG